VLSGKVKSETANFLRVDGTLLLLVDFQVKLARVMHDREILLENVRKLVKGMVALDVPVLWAEQNPDGLGPTVPEIAGFLAGEPVTKFSFSCCGEARFTEALNRFGRGQILVAGIETHVCIYQTAVDLLREGYEVQVVTDAVSSRTSQDKQIGLQKIKDAGGAWTSVETVLFELLKVAKGTKFKEILKIVK